MIVDAQNYFCEDLALTATAVATNVINLSSTNLLKDIGDGTPVYLVFAVTTVLDSAGEAATLTITLESDDNTSLSSATTHWTSGSIAEATLVAGYKLTIPLPLGKTYQQYVGVRFTVGTENFTSGNVSAFLTTSPDSNTVYANNYTIAQS
jgi:hypothetical protein